MWEILTSSLADIAWNEMGLREKWKARQQRRRFRDKPYGRMMNIYIKNDESNLDKIGNWHAWNTDEEKIEYDLMYPPNFSSGAFVLAKPIVSDVYCGFFKFNAQCYSNDPGKLSFGFATEHPVDFILNDAFVAIKFGDEEPKNFQVTLYKRFPTHWFFDEEDAKFIKSALQKSSRMLVRWYQFRDDIIVPVTAEFDLDGWQLVSTEIKRRCKDYLRELMRTS